MWGRSYSDHSVYAEPHRLALFIDVADSMKKDRVGLLAGVRKMCEEDRKMSSSSAGVGFHVLFHLEIDIETNEFEIEDKLGRRLLIAIAPMYSDV